MFTDDRGTVQRERGRLRSGDGRASVLFSSTSSWLRPRTRLHRETKALTTRVHVSLRCRPRVSPHRVLGQPALSLGVTAQVNPRMIP